jgi:MEMO1 family protein
MGVTPLSATVRPPLVDGLFSPGRREALAALIDRLLERSPSPKSACRAILTPHAGYDFVGDVMAAAYRSISLRRVRTAVLIGPAHRDGEDALYLPESESFGTPLGEMPVDRRSVAALCARDPLFRVNDVPHLEEHCLELQLPFLSRIFPGVSIVPILVGGARMGTATTLARSLQLTFSESADYTVFVVSANIASYMTGKNPEAERDLMESLLERGDWRGIMAAAEKRQVSACCAAGIAAVLSLAAPARVQVLDRARSGDAEDDGSRIVHYAGVSIDTLRE